MKNMMNFIVIRGITYSNKKFQGERIDNYILSPYM